MTIAYGLVRRELMERVVADRDKWARKAVALSVENEKLKAALADAEVENTRLLEMLEGWSK